MTGARRARSRLLLAALLAALLGGSLRAEEGRAVAVVVDR